MRILIIGGTGVLSTDIVKECLLHGDTVYVINRGHNQTAEEARYHQITCDIRDTPSVTKKIGNLRFDVVADFLSYNSSQLNNTYRIFAPRCKQFVFISSCCVFRRSSEDGVICEESYKPNKVFSYGYDKYLCEQKLQELSKDFECKYTIVRPYITYGDTRVPFGLSPRERYHWTIVGRILADKPFFIWDEGENMCTLLHTIDFAKIFYLLLLNPKAYNQDVNLTGSKACKWIDVLKTLYHLLGKEEKHIVNIPKDYIAQEMPRFKELLLGDRSLNAVFDNRKLLNIVPEAKQILEDSISLGEGLARTIMSYKDNGFYGGIDYKYDAQIDRLIASFLPPSDDRRKKLGYVDFLGNSSRKNFFRYLQYRYLTSTQNALIEKIERKILKK